METIYEVEGLCDIFNFVLRCDIWISNLFISLGMSGFELLQMLARFNYYACFFIVCVSYYYMSGADRNSVREASETGGHGAYMKTMH